VYIVLSCLPIFDNTDDLRYHLPMIFAASYTSHREAFVFRNVLSRRYHFASELVRSPQCLLEEYDRNRQGQDGVVAAANPEINMQQLCIDNQHDCQAPGVIRRLAALSPKLQRDRRTWRTAACRAGGSASGKDRAPRHPPKLQALRCFPEHGN
jgi:hypothetical protein